MEEHPPKSLADLLGVVQKASQRIIRPVRWPDDTGEYIRLEAEIEFTVSKTDGISVTWYDYIIAIEPLEKSNAKITVRVTPRTTWEQYGTDTREYLRSSDPKSYDALWGIANPYATGLGQVQEFALDATDAETQATVAALRAHLGTAPKGAQAIVCIPVSAPVRRPDAEERWRLFVGGEIVASQGEVPLLQSEWYQRQLSDSLREAVSSEGVTWITLDLKQVPTGVGAVILQDADRVAALPRSHSPAFRAPGADFSTLPATVVTRVVWDRGMENRVILWVPNSAQPVRLPDGRQVYGFYV